LALLGLVLLPAGCSREATEDAVPDTADVSISNQELEVTLQKVPDGMVVKINEGRNLILSPATPEHGVLLKVEVGAPEVGVNLVAAVQEHQDHIEDLPGGTYNGKTELICHLGTAFLSRGQFDQPPSEDGLIEGVRIEESRVFALHPSQDRLLSLVYSYPAPSGPEGTSSRAKALLAVLESVR
jgi:hypothetical protein